MAMERRELQPYVARELQFDRVWLESVVLELADSFEIRIRWNRETAMWTGGFAIVGGLLGGYTGGKMGAALGAGLGSVTGFGVSTVVTLREVWEVLKEKMEELVFIVFNYLRSLNIADYERAYYMLRTAGNNRRELVITIVEFLVEKLGPVVLSSITA